MKILYLLRHAKAEAGLKNMRDQDRKLAPRGVEACGIIGAMMQKKYYIPALALCSPSARTTETLTRVMQASGQIWPTQPVEKLYLATAEELLQEVLSAANLLPSLMLVGHNPGMHHAALSLASPEPTRLRHKLDMKYPTGALAVLRFAVDDWADISPATGELVDFCTPLAEEA